MQKCGRNDPCLCGSGKKFKKCCESKKSRSLLQAQPISETSNQLIQKTANLSQFFQTQLAMTPKITRCLCCDQAETPLEDCR